MPVDTDNVHGAAICVEVFEGDLTAVWPIENIVRL